MPVAREFSGCPEGAIIQDCVEIEDRIAVVYDSRERPPEITIKCSEKQVQTVMANGVAVAIVACAEGPRLTVDDILLVERVVC